MRNYINPIVVFCAVILTSCGVHYKNPPKDLQRTSTIRGQQKRDGLVSWTWSIYTVEVIDNTPVQLMKNDNEIVLNSGTHNVVLSAFFARGFGLGPYRARGDVTMHFVAGRNYKVNGRLEGSKMLLWIEDAETAKVASKVINLPYHEAPQASYVPIYLPSN